MCFDFRLAHGFEPLVERYAKILYPSVDAWAWGFVQGTCVNGVDHERVVACAQEVRELTQVVGWIDDELIVRPEKDTTFPVERLIEEERIPNVPHQSRAIGFAERIDIQFPNQLCVPLGHAFQLPNAFVTALESREHVEWMPAEFIDRRVDAIREIPIRPNYL
jgi:hypothetical protein